jgi:hypothetical protein
MDSVYIKGVKREGCGPSTRDYTSRHRQTTPPYGLVHPTDAKKEEEKNRLSIYVL